ncbi:hypothetical protein GCM10011365_02120 [Marinicella pacifica]|jgi:biopolymer transport protein ExbB/TolQ|uniref:MotA/TolQ/ExbB proton channel domain-containing protein n=1 Tax=Marinicella pacifica TaxID=1171543 RepID=A0A917FIT7_9GAMM|nr:MotA/TolQ/ExbB proton channel family protein [Marinicella pacifica]GGF84707.1 hypothetical protein GCM10011365_02120 [Marinicella pacifica]
MNIEAILYTLSSWFMVPVLAAIVIAFLYALYQLGQFLTEVWQRRFGKNYCCHLAKVSDQQNLDSEQLELLILQELEGLKVTARVAPLLGLVATMIPMGPALAGVSAGEMSVVGEQVGMAFAAVIVALMAASVAFVILTVKRRWRLASLLQIEKQQKQVTEEPVYLQRKSA